MTRSAPYDGERDDLDRAIKNLKRRRNEIVPLSTRVLNLVFGAAITLAIAAVLFGVATYAVKFAWRAWHA